MVNKMKNITRFFNKEEAFNEAKKNYNCFVVEVTWNYGLTDFYLCVGYEVEEINEIIANGLDIIVKIEHYFFNECQNTGLTFEWLKGSANDNIIKVFKENNIDYYYNEFFSLVADINKDSNYVRVDYKHIENRLFEIIVK